MPKNKGLRSVYKLATGLLEKKNKKFDYEIVAMKRGYYLSEMISLFAREPDEQASKLVLEWLVDGVPSFCSGTGITPEEFLGLHQLEKNWFLEGCKKHLSQLSASVDEWSPSDAEFKRIRRQMAELESVIAHLSEGG